MKTIVYIDGFNLYYRLKATDKGNKASCIGKRRHYKWLDLGKLIDRLLKNHFDVVQIKYFTSLVKSTVDDPSKPERQQAYLRTIEKIDNLEIIKGNFKQRDISGIKLIPLKNGQFKLSDEVVRIQKFEEKESDVNIACHIVADSAKEDIDCVALLSNDTDLVLPLKMAREKFHKKVCLISPRTTHADLNKVADFKRRITNPVITACQFPDIVDGIHRPRNW